MVWVAEPELVEGLLPEVRRDREMWHAKGYWRNTPGVSTPIVRAVASLSVAAMWIVSSLESRINVISENHVVPSSEP